jgi:hypothetical protein
MKTAIRLASVAGLGCITALVLAGTAMTQTAGVATGVTANGTTQFRDPMTGKVWTPENVSKDNRLQPANQPPSPADKAFDPRTQIATAVGIEVQRPPATLLGVVPITAGPNVPIVTIDGPSLQAIPGQRWLTVLYVTNNSSANVTPEVGCTFTNGGRPAQETRVIVPTAGPGQRLGLSVYGPRTDIFVDRVLCRLIAP